MRKSAGFGNEVAGSRERSGPAQAADASEHAAESEEEAGTAACHAGRTISASLTSGCQALQTAPLRGGRARGPPMLRAGLLQDDTLSVSHNRQDIILADVRHTLLPR